MYDCDVEMIESFYFIVYFLLLDFVIYFFGKGFFELYLLFLKYLEELNDLYID